MLFELSEARRPVNLKERVKDRVSRNTLSSSSSTCCTKHTASRKYCVWRRACVPGARSGTSLRQCISLYFGLIRRRLLYLEPTTRVTVFSGLVVDLLRQI